jgi:thioredoxin reductase (NADPH)
MKSQYDVVVVGGGAAGLAGAVALARSRRSVLVIDAGAPRNARADGVHNFLTREGTPPADLLALGRAEVTGYGGEVVSGQVTGVQRDEDGKGFGVSLADGRKVNARRLLITTGATDELPAIPGLAERWGHDVLHCPFCHGWEARDRAIGILGTGPMAMHATLLWRQISPDVTLFLHTAPALTPEQSEQLAALGVRVVEGEVSELVIADDHLVGVQMRDGEVIPRDILVAASVVHAHAGLLKVFGLESEPLEMGGQVLATRVTPGAVGSTDIPGVWVAGNVADPMGQVITAAADGMRAGAAIHMDLITEDTAQAVADHRAAASTLAVAGAG